MTIKIILTILNPSAAEILQSLLFTAMGTCTARDKKPKYYQKRSGCSGLQDETCAVGVDLDLQLLLSHTTTTTTTTATTAITTITVTGIKKPVTVISIIAEGDIISRSILLMYVFFATRLRSLEAFPDHMHPRFTRSLSSLATAASESASSTVQGGSYRSLAKRVVDRTPWG